MIKSITDNIRNKLYKDKNPLLVLSRLDNIPINKREDYVRLIILDYLVFNFDERLTLNIPYDDLIKINVDRIVLNSIKSNYEELASMVMDAIPMNQMNLITKSYIYENFLNYKVILDKLKNTSPYYLLDAISYWIECNLNCFIEYYMDFKNKTNESVLEEESAIIDIFCLKLNSEYKINSNKYNLIILELVKDSYKWLFYKKNNVDHLSKEEELIYKFIKFSNIDMLLKSTVGNYELIKSLLYIYLNYHTNENIYDVDEFYNNNTSDAIKKKLEKREN